MTKIATCIVCKDEPLVMTFQFYKKEFICISCGRLYEFFGPSPRDETPELLAKMEERKQEWLDNASGLIIGRFYRDSCEKCSLRGDHYHSKHATEAEWEAHEVAVDWLSKRTGRDFSTYSRKIPV